MSTLSVTNLKNAASATNNLVLNPDGSVNISGGTLSPQTGFKNRIINGNMTIDQRNAGASVTPASLAVTYTLDRWAFYVTQASKLTTQQNAGSVTPPSGFRNYLGVTSSSAYSSISTDKFVLYQPIEGFNVADLGWGAASAQTVTLSFWVRSSLTGTFGASVQNSGNTRAYPFPFTVTAANTWEQKTVSIAGDTTGTWLTTNGAGLTLAFNLGSGSNYLGTANSWQAGDFAAPTGATSVVGTSGATFYITGVQLEKGSVATPFEFRSIGTELGLCQRYYISAANHTFIYGAANQYVGVQFPVTMRASPTVTITAGGTPSNIATSPNGFRSNNGTASQDAAYTAAIEL
jgi:hypothetical protein